MSNRSVAIILAVLTAIFIVLNFTVDAGTIFLILAVVTGIGAGYYFGKA